MEKVDFLKLLLTAAFGWLSAILGALYVPVLLLVACNLIDYATGLMAASRRADSGISSYRSIQGIMKKVSMWLLVVVGAIMDQLLLYSAEAVGYPLPFTFLVAAVVAVWIICNELISILENMVDIGISIPSFLLPLVGNLKTTLEKLGTQEAPQEKE